MDILLSRYRLKSCLIYLDDIILFSNTVEEHLTHVEEVLQVLRDSGFSPKLKKCNFFAQSADYLGHVIRPGTLEVATKNTQAVERFDEFRTQTELRSFLGLCNVYRRFFPNFARTAAPLNALFTKCCLADLQKSKEEQSKAFKLLKQALISPPVPSHPKPGVSFSVDTDACNDQVGCALLQVSESGRRHPIGFRSRSLSAAVFVPPLRT